MNYTAKLEHFEGPLDLLLQLIEQSELEITKITLSDVTSQYLTYIRNLSPEAGDLQEFLNLAARLVYLKSVALLPSLATAEEDEELHELAVQLEQYQRYSKAAAHLQNLISSNQPSYSRPIKTNLPPHTQALPSINLAALAEVFQQEIARLPELPSTSIEEQIDLEEGCRRLRQGLDEGHASLSKIFRKSTNRYEALVIFLALLEMIKNGEIAALQSAPHEDITLEYEKAAAATAS